MTLARWFSTVRTETNSIEAISALVCPSAMRRSTSRSRSLRSSIARARTRPGVSRHRASAAPQRGLEVFRTSGDVSNRVDELRRGRLLQEVAARAGGETHLHVRRVVHHREHQDRGGRVALLETADHLGPRSSGSIKSATTTSARTSSATASSTEPASATTVTPSCRSRSARKPSRTTTWSSIRSTPIVAPFTRSLSPGRRCG